MALIPAVAAQAGRGGEEDVLFRYERGMHRLDVLNCLAIVS